MKNEATLTEIKDSSPGQKEKQLKTLAERFAGNPSRHKGIKWEDVQSRLVSSPKKLQVLERMENTGGEPDVTGYDRKTDEYIFTDCSPETPEGRRNCCYDAAGQRMREKKGIFPGGNAVDIASSIGIELITPEQYSELQKLGEFDTRTSGWLKTPEDIRKKGGAIFGDRRYGHVFVYHNSAQSFYSSRGFRGILRV